MVTLLGRVDGGRRLASFRPSPLFLVAALCALGALTLAVDTLRLVVTYFQPLFFWDPWGTVDQYAQFLQGNYRFSDLFTQYNEHRIAFPLLIFLMDFTFGRGLNVINIAAILFIQFLHFLLLARLARRLGRSAISVIAISVTAVLLFTFGQSENFTWGFQVQFVGVYAAASLAFWWFCAAAERQWRGRSATAFAIGAFVMAAVATYTMANGIIAAAVLVFLGLALRAKIRLTLSAVLLTAALAASYFYDFHLVGAHSPPGYVLQHPLEVLVYILVYVGGLAGPFGLFAAGLLGAAGLAATAFAVFRMIWRREQAAPRAALVAIMMFIAATAVVTAFGRAFFGLDQALSSRYLTPACIFWAAQVIYWSSFAQQKPPNRPVLAILSVLFLTVAAGATRAHFAQEASAVEIFRNLNLASDALLSGGDLPEAVELASPEPAVPKRLAPFLDQQRLSIFSWPEAQWRDRPLREVFARIDDQACSGNFDDLATPPESIGAAAAGWAWDRLRRSPVGRVVLVGSNDHIIGFASGGWDRGDVRKAVSEVKRKAVGWEGFVKLRDGGPVRAYAVLDHGRVACELGEHAPPEEGDRVGARPLDADLKSLGPSIDAPYALSGEWVLNEENPSAGAPAAPGPIYGSRSGSNSSRGEVAIGPFHAPNGAFALPIMTGASAEGQSIVVKDAQTGEIYVSVRLRARPQWSAAIFTIPPEQASHPLLLVAADKGRNAVQGMAIGAPRIPPP
jgi:hypothetical protein